MKKNIERLRTAEAAARELARMIDKALPKGWFFVLNLFDTQYHQSTYISNADPDDVPASLRECADHIEEREKGKTPRGL